MTSLIDRMNQYLTTEGLMSRPQTHPVDLLKEARDEIVALNKIIDGCRWYRNADDHEHAVDGPWDILHEVGPNSVCEIERGGVVETRFMAYLDAAEDSDSDDEFEVDEATAEAAQAKLDAEIARRDTISKKSE